MRRRNRPEQLQLELDWSYLEQLEASGEAWETYEKSAVSLYRKQVLFLPHNPLIEEIVAERNPQ